jgi:3'-phosphoadenosine 5'-phosphosulfate sulfotransferase (PAPS reductase)/FAD synthetase
MADRKVRHVLGLSGGKDSTALAIMMKDKIPDVEYFFSDTGAELPETYEYIDKLEAFLGKPIKRLGADKPFETLLDKHGGYLPSPRARWCTTAMKIEPFEKFVGNDVVYSYIGIRADENREGYISSKPNIIPVFPLKEAGITLKGVQEILDRSGIGLPKYYEWRSRSGCYFCFFQQRSEWVGLKERHPDLFEKAKTFEKTDPNGKKFTWIQGLTLTDVENNAEEIVERSKERKARIAASVKKTALYDIFAEDKLDDGEDSSCLICEL